jgi:hypothetical protein
LLLKKAPLDRVGAGLPTRPRAPWLPGVVQSPAGLPNHAGTHRAWCHWRLSRARHPALWLHAVVHAIRRCGSSGGGTVRGAEILRLGSPQLSQATEGDLTCRVRITSSLLRGDIIRCTCKFVHFLEGV